MSSYCTPPGDLAGNIVSNGYNTFVNLAQQTYNLALQATNALGGYTIQPVTFNADFRFDEALTNFVRPTRPEIDFSKFEISVPALPNAPTRFDTGDVSFDAAPTFDVAPPELRQIQAPTTPNIVAPGDAPRFLAPVMPDAPVYDLPALPTLETLDLPPVPTIQIPLFSATRPEDDIPDFTESWSFEPQAYVSQMLDTVKSRLGQMLAGGTGLPPEIERAIFERGRARLDEEGARAVQEAYDEFGARGFTEPNGMLAARVERVRQNTRNQAAEVVRDVIIRAKDVEIENLRFAVQQGIALETVLSNLHLEEQRLLLAAAQFIRDSAVSVLNAKISLFNARLQGYQTDAQVYAERVRGELAKAEVYRAQIDGERARGEINQQRVALYSEQVRTVGVLADVYRSQVQAVQAEVEANTTQIEGYRAEVQAYSERWRAHVSEWDGYRAAVEAEGRRADVYGTMAQTFATRVQAWDRQQQTKLDRERLRIAQHGQSLQVWEADLRRVLAVLQSEQARVGAVAQGASAVAQLYGADASVASAESAANDRKFELGLQRERAIVDTELQAAQSRIQENIQLLTLLGRARETMAQVFSQLTASTMAAVNFSASVGSSTSQSSGCSTSFNFSGEIGDARR